MNILLLNQYFYPDSAATSQFLTDLARSLAVEGHSVRTICGRSSYAEANCLQPLPVEIVRTPVLPFTHSLLSRAFSYMSFLSGALCRGVLGPTPDLIVTLTTPPALGVIGCWIKAVTGARHYIWEMDVYPDVAIDLEVLRARSWFTRALGSSFDKSRRRADGIIALGECMRTRLMRRGVPGHLIHVAENWADGREIHPLPFPPLEPFTVLYSGNLGLAHDVATIRGAIHHFRSNPRFRFVFAGSGPQRKGLESFCRKHAITNVTFTGYRPRHELAESLGNCHIGLVTQKPVTLGSVVPSKTYGIMAAGRPILYIGPREATPAGIVGRFRCGWQIDPGDTANLILLLEHLAGNPGLIREAGARGREAFLQHYDLPIGVARICSILGVSQPQPPAKAVAV
ncbi:MAG: glycosyltransferase family 4 protein [Acidobacteriia bacterium]|nr:glycosyltransferase family 4 protein [Terriglobia bacterium]